MTHFPYEPPCPPWLEDEALIIERAGEMPEVALAESLLQVGPVRPQEEDALRAACGRGYLAAIRRDLDPAAPGRPEFRGLDRALANWRRLVGFTARAGRELDPRVGPELGRELAGFLEAEERAVELGRPWTAAAAPAARELALAWGLDPARWEPLWRRLEGLPAPDFLGLRALARLQAPRAAAKRRRLKGGKAFLELVDGRGRALAGAALPWRSDVAEVAREHRERAELVWSLLPLPEEEA